MTSGESSRLNSFLSTPKKQKPQKTKTRQHGPAGCHVDTDCQLAANVTFCAMDALCFSRK
jgi:hypothetical protein